MPTISFSFQLRDNIRQNDFKEILAFYFFNGKPFALRDSEVILFDDFC